MMNIFLSDKDPTVDRDEISRKKITDAFWGAEMKFPGIKTHRCILGDIDEISRYKNSLMHFRGTQMKSPGVKTP